MTIEAMIIIGSFLIMGCLLGWVMGKGKTIDNDINIKKNKIDWWRDKNIK